MKRRWLTTLALLVAVPLLTAAVHLRPRTVMPGECSGLYLRYAGSPAIRSAYIKDYKVNDTLTLSATILEALTDDGWDSLSAAFALLPDTAQREALDRGQDVLTLLTTVGDTDQSALSLGVASLRDRYICVFHPADTADRQAILSAVIKLMVNSVKTEHKLNEP